MSIFKSSIITHEQCMPRVTQAQHASYIFKISPGTTHLCVFFCKHGLELYHS